jgi:hypothetical protein
LKTGKQPSKKSGTILTEIRRYCAIAKIGQDSCLVVPAPSTLSSTKQPDRIVIPTPLIPALLWHIHNHDNHPTKTQLKAKFDRMFYGIMVQQHLDNLYQDCYQCKATAVLPIAKPTHTACTPVQHPGQYFHADVIRREKQKILIIRDNFSSLVAATIIPTEQAADIKSALITLTSTMRLSSQITVRTDAATGFQALVQDQDLHSIGIQIQLGDVINKNSNAVADRACLELEQEITKLQRQAGPITLTTLAEAVLILNRKVRRPDKLTAMEIHYARSQTDLHNLILKDDKLRQSQLQIRQNSNPQSPAPLQPGDTVVLKQRPSKHMARDMFIVTSVTDRSTNIQKIAPASNTMHLRSKTYSTAPAFLQLVHRALNKSKLS